MHVDALQVLDEQQYASENHHRLRVPDALGSGLIPVDTLDVDGELI